MTEASEANYWDNYFECAANTRQPSYSLANFLTARINRASFLPLPSGAVMMILSRTVSIERICSCKSSGLLIPNFLRPFAMNG